MRLRPDGNVYRHGVERTARPEEFPGDGHHLPNIAANRNRDEVGAAHTAVRRTESDPARSGNIASAQTWVDPKPTIPASSWEGLCR